MLGSGPGKLGLIAHDRFGDAVCLVVEYEREKIVASLLPRSSLSSTKMLSSLANGNS